MTKNRDIKILIVLISILVIIGLLVLSFEIQNKANTLTSSSYNARKDDLTAKQADLEKAIIILNNTLNEEKARQQVLADQIAALKNQTPSKTPSGSSSSPTPPAPKPTPSPPPVTRAS